MQKSRRVKTESSFGICFEKFRTTRETFTQKCSFKNSNKIEVNFFFFHRLYFFFLSFLMHFKWFYVSFAFSSILRMTGKRSSLRCYFLHLLLQVTHGASLAPEPEILHPPFAADIVKQLLLLAHLLGILVNLLLSMTLNHDTLRNIF